jgi:hypothetical protein
MVDYLSMRGDACRELYNFARACCGNPANSSAVPFGATVCQAFQCRKTQRVLKIIEKSEQN